MFPNLALAEAHSGNMMVLSLPKFPNLAAPRHTLADHGLKFPTSCLSWHLGGMLWQYDGFGFPNTLPSWHLGGILLQFPGLEFPKSSPSWHLGGTLWQYCGLEFPKSLATRHFRGMPWQYHGLEFPKSFPTWHGRRILWCIMDLGFPKASLAAISEAHAGNIIALSSPTVSQPGTPRHAQAISWPRVSQILATWHCGGILWQCYGLEFPCLASQSLTMTILWP